MDVKEIREKKLVMEKRIADLLNEFEKDTGCPVSDIELIRRGVYTVGGDEKDFYYAIDSEVKI